MKIIEINEFDLNFCPYCGNKLLYSTYEQEEDDLHYHCRVSVFECKKCKRDY